MNPQLLKVLTFIALLGIMLLMKTLLFPTYSRKKSKEVKDNIEGLKNKGLELRKVQVRQDLILELASICKNIPLFILSTHQREKLVFYIKRLDLKRDKVTILPEEIYMNQVGIATVFILAVVMLTIIFKVAILALLAYPVIYSAYSKSIEKKIKISDDLIRQDFPAFYSVIFYQCKSLTGPVPNLRIMVENYVPFAGEEIEKMLKKMLAYMEFGEGYALKRIKEEYPIKEVIRFCNDVGTRLNGEDNVLNLAEFKNQLDTEELVALDKIAEKKVLHIAIVNKLLWLILGQAMIIHFIGQGLTIRK